MNTISINGKKFTAPQHWGEMTEQNLLDWAKIVEKKINRTDAFALAVIMFYGIKPRLYFKLEPAHHVQLKNTLSFLADENYLNKWLVKSFKVFPFVKYYGPEDYLSTSTIKEFRYSEIFYHNYKKTNNTEFLDKLIATLFRKKGQSELDRREKVTRMLVATNAHQIKSLSPILKNAILFNYEGCRNAIFKAYPTVFKSNENGSKSTETPDLDHIINVVSGGKFGTFSQTEETPIFRFLDHLKNEIAENQKQQRNAKSR